MSFGFSASDLVVVGKLVYSITDTLRNARPEYQELIRELESLDRALHHIDKLGGPPDRSIAVDEIKCAALTCRYPLESFLAKIRRYEKTLGLGKSSGPLQNAAHRLRWAFSMNEEASRLRELLNMHVGTINTMLATKGLEQLEVASTEAAETRAAMEGHIERSSMELKSFRGDINTQSLAIQENNSVLSKLFQMVGGEVAAPLRSLSELVAKACVSTQQIYTIVLELRASARPIDTRFTYFQEPVRVEDVLGRVFPFPSECSIEALDVEIKARFKQGPGKAEVLAEAYEIANAKDSKQVLTVDNNAMLLPGMSITMAIVVEKPSNESDQCPSCPSRIFEEVTCGGKICAGCDVWFAAASKKRKRPAQRHVKPKGLTITQRYDANDDRQQHLTSFKRIRIEGVERPGRKRRTQPSRGDAVLIGLLGGLNNPEIAARAGEEPLYSASQSECSEGECDERERSEYEVKRERKLEIEETLSDIDLEQMAQMAQNAIDAVRSPLCYRY